jgi:hypothetical protein
MGPDHDCGDDDPRQYIDDHGNDVRAMNPSHQRCEFEDTATSKAHKRKAVDGNVAQPTKKAKPGQDTKPQVEDEAVKPGSPQVVVPPMEQSNGKYNIRLNPASPGPATYSLATVFSSVFVAT